HPVSYAADLEITVFRCYEDTLDNSMPELYELDSLARDALDDARAMMRAVQCAFDRGTPMYCGPWIPKGPNGGIHGGHPVSYAADLEITVFRCYEDTLDNSMPELYELDS
ncbi:hypothetical protein ACXKGW_29805, partial [Klebsiella pneumoniae subsp. pneumoniae]